ncbi:MAG: hypothetical protein A2528_03245 [Candidatus Staskawiczbacteria bacterium RIFOXYD2_FULL_37_9]|uniref:VOC domain-containing protein n=1 Tax=Candidatus Staskawiczbacteria bacterium RIFOXYB1_FULL_37_44 TaxID=1802223 RepID=A0A1G2IX66_9BACT|nr:MAG: hypothetical protein A2358_00545 [Candidatus Staskawiczbacteria bacterium RIFOXYB1_FULL_37_44]OGZ83499.1 MAG: hypothetical protein A2416_04210 [Candidatus Staskawiczbacteria bacterium RIFOXYC1_FULL_37_52]OGZ87931.1 MAG: hypothetical protein A2444_02175 [Candidatus Staskawiczbacteria bacterium RIFOXYC2_FULL_37_19]OGZ90163.1 MAG: hypothetical protein A2581_01990 [Candidatus Staskawiczbacteria bacterium RIFOXYD1_FULL_37_110]OGZ93725.1 MAG: hypothetical protein A2528_03245 [Candidatus Stask
MDKVVHFELPADNVERAKKFYKEAFNWQIEDVPEMSYIIVRTTEVDNERMPKTPGAINGGMFKRGDMNNPVTSPTFSIDVANIDDAIKMIKNAGGLILKDKTAVGDMGFMAYFKDTEGNILSVWQGTKKK